MALFWDLLYLFGAPWDTGKPSSQLEELVGNGRIKPCKSLDIGCGTGTNIIYLAGKGFEAVGIDMSNVAIRRAKRRALKQNVKCEIRKLDFRDPQAIKSAKLTNFDLLIDQGCYHSMFPRDRERYGESLLRVSHRGTMYLLWCFLKNPRRIFGPPGVFAEEVENHFSKDFQILEKRELFNRGVLFYLMERIGS